MQPDPGLEDDRIIQGRRDGPAPESERRRLGELATVRPGESVPLTVSWRRDGAAALELGGTRVPLP